MANSADDRTSEEKGKIAARAVVLFQSGFSFSSRTSISELDAFERQMLLALAEVDHEAERERRDPEYAERLLQNLRASFNPPDAFNPPSAPRFSACSDISTLIIGGKTGVEYAEGLKRTGCRITPRVERVLHSMDTTSPAREIMVAQFTVRALGFPECARYNDILAHARASGLDPCPAEVGPALCLALTDPSVWHQRTIVMDSIANDSGSPELFTVCRHKYTREKILETSWTLQREWGRRTLQDPDDRYDLFVFAVSDALRNQISARTVYYWKPEVRCP